MKKLLIAIAIVFALAGIAVVGTGYYLYRQARTMMASFAEFGNVAEIESSLRNRGSYTPPASEELTDAQVERLVRVQTQVKQRLGDRFAEMERKYKSLADKKEASLADVPALMAAYRDLAQAWVDGKRAQVAALNEAELSLEEYRWIREQCYRAIGMPFMDLDIEKMVSAAQSGTAPDPGAQLRGAVGPAGPEANQKLVARHKKLLEDNVVLASFGL